MKYIFLNHSAKEDNLLTSNSERFKYSKISPSDAMQMIVDRGDIISELDDAESETAVSALVSKSNLIPEVNLYMHVNE